MNQLAPPPQDEDDDNLDDLDPELVAAAQ